MGSCRTAVGSGQRAAGALEYTAALQMAVGSRSPSANCQAVGILVLVGVLVLVLMLAPVLVVILVLVGCWCKFWC